jgi:hypothetical protein
VQYSSLYELNASTFDQLVKNGPSQALPPKSMKSAVIVLDSGVRKVHDHFCWVKPMSGT